jgi:hypothetical protein
MNRQLKDKLLKVALFVFGAIFLLVYPMGMIWPSGWIWHGGEGQYYLQMICSVYAVLGACFSMSARNPEQHTSLISFTIWSSVVHDACHGSAGSARSERGPNKARSSLADGTTFLGADVRAKHVPSFKCGRERVRMSINLMSLQARQ